MRMPKSEKGQATMIDFMMALFIFIIVIGYLTTVWLINLSTIENNYVLDDMQRLAFQATDLLIRSEGLPSNWEVMDIDDVNRIGLAERDRVIDEQKLNSFKNLGAEYERVKQLLQIANYDFHFELQGADDVNAGLPCMAAAQKAVVKRAVNYKGSEAIVTFTLYKVR